MGNDFKWSYLPRWLFRACIVAGGNFALFAVITFASGGDALNGEREGGRYFLGSHGHYTEVARSFYYFSYIHACVTVLLIFFCLVSVSWVTLSSGPSKKKNA
jgi:hypothetical protein